MRYGILISEVIISLIYIISMIRFLFKLNGRSMSDSEAGTIATLTVSTLIIMIFIFMTIWWSIYNYL